MKQLYNKFIKINIIILIFSLIFVILSLYFKFLNLYKESDEKNYQKFFIVNNSIKNIIDIYQTKQVKTKEQIKLEEIQENNSEVICWLKINGTKINYPVAQTNNNDYYLEHNQYKKKDKRGCLFLDKDNQIDNKNSNLIIYGHNMKNQTMFGELLMYKNFNFYNNHKLIELSTKHVVAKYRIISIFASEVFYKDQKVFKYYNFKNSLTKTEYETYVKGIKDLSLYNIDETAEYGEQLLTLSTCDYYKKDGRFVIVAKKI